MNRKIAYILFVSLLLIFGIGSAFLLYLSKEKRREIACSSIEISFSDSLKFVSEEDIKSFLKKNYGEYIGQKIDSVALWRIEELVESRSAVTGSEAWISSDGVLHLTISQRAPELRFMNGNKGFYVDSQGYIFPLHKSYTADVDVITGAIPIQYSENYQGYASTESDKEWIEGVLHLYRELKRNKTWRNMLEGISVRRNGDLAVKMKTGSELFILGEPRRIDEKLKNLETYTLKIAPSVEKDYYKSVNLKYKKQIICRKDI